MSADLSPKTLPRTLALTGPRVPVVQAVTCLIADAYRKLTVEIAGRLDFNERMPGYEAGTARRTPVSRLLQAGNRHRSMMRPARVNMDTRRTSRPAQGCHG